MNKETGLPKLEGDDIRIAKFGRYFLCAIVEKLDVEMKSEGIDEERRRSICSVFADQLATFLDFGWLEDEEERLWPVLAFAKRSGITDVSSGIVENLVVAVSDTMHSEGGPENALEYHFDKDEDTLEEMNFKSGVGLNS